MRDMTFATAVREAEALRRLGQTRIHLDANDPNLPWSSVTGCEPGGTHRHSLCVNVVMTAEHSGLTFRWFVDTEPHSANGQPQPLIDAAHCRRIAALLPLKPRREFGAYLADCSAKCAQFAAEHSAIVARQTRTAEELRQIAAEVQS